MSDQRSVMKEFRFLDQKRQTTGLSAEEATRYAQLRDLVGPDTAAPPRAGFDVNAAAARLRESLLPGGLRGQVPAADLSPDPEAPPEPEAEAAPEATALEAAWEEQPFAPLDVEPTPAADPLFDPASLGTEVRPQAWNPEAPGYDPNAPYDEAAWIAAGYDPNATYDWSAYEADGQAPPPEAGSAEEAPAAEAPLEEPPLEEAAAPVEAAEVVALAEVEVGAVEFAEEIAAEEAFAVEPPAAEPEPAVEALPFDPHAPFDHAKWFGRTSPQATQAELAEPADAAALEPGAAAAGVPELEPLAEPALEPEPAPEAAAEAAWAAAEVAQPIEIAEEAGFETAPDATYAADDGQADPYALEAARALAAAPPLPYAVEAPEPYAAAPAAGFEAAADGAAWSEPAAEPLDLGDPAAEPAPEPAAEASPDPLLLPEEGDLPPAAPSDAWFDASTEPPPAPALAFGDYDADARGVPAGLAAMMIEPLPEPPVPVADAVEPVGDGSATPYQAAPEGAAFGEYDESAPGSAPALALEEAAFSALPFDPAAASVIDPGELPEGYDAGGPTLDPASLPPPAASASDGAAFPADAAYGGPEGDSLPGGTPLELGEPVQDWLPEQALEQGFELASDGSFGELDRPVLTPVPGWATVEEVAAATAAAAPATTWESPPALDLSAPFDLSLPAAPPGPEAAAAAEAPLEYPAEAPLEYQPEAALEPLAELPVDELPTLAAEDILEELPPVAEPILDQGEPAPEDAPEPTAEYEPFTAPEAEAAYAEALAAAEVPAEGEIPPEIAAAFGDAPAEADPFAVAGAGPVEPVLAAPADPYAPPLAEAYEPPPAEADVPSAAEPSASPRFAEPPPASGPAFGAGEPEPIVEEAAAPEPEAYMEPEPLPGPEAAPQVWIEGSHRVVLHTVDGQVKRGLLVDAALDAVELALQPQGPGTPEHVGTDNVKAIFFMLAPGEKAAAPVGKKVRVTFRDGRQVAGYSPDYVEGTIGFFMIPADTRTNTGRIWVYQSAVRQVTVS